MADILHLLCCIPQQQTTVAHRSIGVADFNTGQQVIVAVERCKLVIETELSF
ncbi:hypothetical protein HG702_11670 [Pectobacterium versatile]|nr:hypothetical protein [Pectobacterium versatile]QQK72081.1 hypothetical protein HG702_11670 [Pectobacterium versatile]